DLVDLRPTHEELVEGAIDELHALVPLGNAVRTIPDVRRRRPEGRVLEGLFVSFVDSLEEVLRQRLELSEPELGGEGVDLLPMDHEGLGVEPLDALHEALRFAV